MKKIFVLMMLTFSIGCFAQETEKSLSFDEVIQEEGKTIKELYPIIKAWVASNFNSANDVIQMDDPENRILICKGNFSYQAPGGMTYRFIDGHVNFTLKIQTREGRYKVTVEDFKHIADDPRYRNTWSFGEITTREKYKMSGMQDKRWTKTWPDLQQTCENQAKEIFFSLKAATSGSNPVIDTEEDW